MLRFDGTSTGQRQLTVKHWLCCSGKDIAFICVFEAAIISSGYGSVGYFKYLWSRRIDERQLHWKKQGGTSTEDLVGYSPDNVGLCNLIMIGSS